MNHRSVKSLIGLPPRGNNSVLESTKSYSTKVENRFADWDDVNSYRGMHNNDTGPGQYNLPQLVAVEKKSLSSMRNSPRHSIGLPSARNKPYHKETYTDFIGRSSPALNKYNPDYSVGKNKDPQFS